MSGGTDRPVLITGGAGFLGCNLADRLAAEGHPVLLLDDLSRPGVERNLAWLLQRHGKRVRLKQADIVDRRSVQAAVAGAAAVFHFAAQVAVTTSVADPLQDFEVNARGTLNVLEAARRAEPQPPVFFASTNKVYGTLTGVDCQPRGRRHEPADALIRRHGITEAQPLDLYSPYGCSKGAADQYVLDYARIFGLPTVVMRMSCLYGPHQFGTEDQGWVAHFLIAALQGRPLTIYGDGRQVRDVLFVADAVEAFLLAWRCLERTRGQAFNLGGGPDHTLSLLELIERAGELFGRAPEVSFAAWRPGDQPWYVSDWRKFAGRTGWRPAVDPRAGTARLAAWLKRTLATPGDPPRVAAGAEA